MGAKVADGTRQRAEQCIQAITPKDVLASGITGDFGEVCLSFIRLLDVENHDPATLAAR